jgi:hypothetical protein
MAWSDTLNFLLNTAQHFGAQKNAAMDRNQQAIGMTMQAGQNLADTKMRGAEMIGGQLSDIGKSFTDNLWKGREMAERMNALESKQAFESAEAREGREFDRPYLDATQKLQQAQLDEMLRRNDPAVIKAERKAAVEGELEPTRALDEKDWTKESTKYNLPYSGREIALPASWDKTSSVERQKILDAWLEQDKLYLENLLFQNRGNAEKDNLRDLTEVMNLTKEGVLLKLHEKNYVDANFVPTWQTPGTAAYNAVDPTNTSQQAMQWRYEKWYESIKKNAPEVFTEIASRDNLLKNTYPQSYAAYTELDKDAVKKYLLSPSQTPEDTLGSPTYDPTEGTPDLPASGLGAGLTGAVNRLEQGALKAGKWLSDLFGIDSSKYDTHIKKWEEEYNQIPGVDKKSDLTKQGVEETEYNIWNLLTTTENIINRFSGNSAAKQKAAGDINAIKGLITSNKDWARSLDEVQANALEAVMGYYALNWTDANYFEENPEKRPTKATWQVFDDIIKRYFKQMGMY